MPADAQTARRTYPAHAYSVGRETIREYAHAVGETDPLHLDVDAARERGHPDLVAPPMFAVVYCAAAIEEALLDPDVGIDYAMLVHGGQEFSWGPLVHAGDEITTVVELAEVSTRIGLKFYRFESRSVSQQGDVVCAGQWTHVVRPRS